MTELVSTDVPSEFKPIYVQDLGLVGYKLNVDGEPVYAFGESEYETFMAALAQLVTVTGILALVPDAESYKDPLF